MDHQPNHPMPAPLAELVEVCINAARHQLTRLGYIHPVAIFGHNDERNAFVFPLETTISEAEAATFIRQLTSHAHADFVLIITEGWMLKADHAPNYQDIIKCYGALEDSPESVECVCFLLETYSGAWGGVTEQKPLADSPGKTFGEVEMIPQKNPEGRLTGLLQSRNNGEVVH
ncbi:hypothetical protein JBO49_16095 [Serratia fonticola]|uniref:hypothetical protein n=1 Tax=Serratia fonticola TaxID=47917 RepID=UPI00192B58B3|nr:hypothetical protein [Serratia fonticola]MBL5862139.1 hypothetical protein [Serratia fonticola]